MNLLSLKGIISDGIIAQLQNIQIVFNSNTPLRMAHFLAQMAKESGDFKKPAPVESLNYSAQRMAEVWPHRYAIDPKVTPFQPNGLSEKLANNQVALGDNVYANRNGNGDETSGDGFKYRGRGYIQLTGKASYQSFSDFIKADCVANPDLVATDYALASAAHFFTKNNIWSICDKGDADSVVADITLKVNGGTVGLPERTAKFKQFYALLNNEA